MDDKFDPDDFEWVPDRLVRAFFLNYGHITQEFLLGSIVAIRKRHDAHFNLYGPVHITAGGWASPYVYVWTSAYSDNPIEVLEELRQHVRDGIEKCKEQSILRAMREVAT